MTNVKLHINITQGIIDAEGDQEFVWRVYEDFRDRLDTASFSPKSQSVPDAEAEDVEQPDFENASTVKPKKRPKRRVSPPAAPTNGKERSSGVKNHKPRLLRDLDTTGIKEFLGQYQLTSHTDIIVAIAKFLESRGVTPASLDAFFTCYSDAALKIPEAFGQAFIRARGDKGFINFSTADDVELTLRGRNHIEHGGIKKAEA